MTHFARARGILSWAVFACLMYAGVSSLPGMARPVVFSQTAREAPGLDRTAAAVPFETATLACG